MENIETSASLWKVILGMLFISSIMGAAFVILANVFAGELRGVISKDPISVAGVIETIRVSNEKEFTDDRKRLIRIQYRLSLEIVYAVNGIYYSFIESYNTDKDGKLYSTLEPVVKLSKRISPDQPITLWRGSEFGRADKEYLYKQNFLPGVQGKRTLQISKKSPGTVISNATDAKKSILGSLVGFVVAFALLFLTSFFTLRNANPTRFTILMLVIILGLAFGISLSSKWFWTGGRNATVFDPSRAIDPDLMTISKDSDPSDWRL